MKITKAKKIFWIVSGSVLVVIPFSVACILNSTAWVASLLLTVPAFLLTLMHKDAKAFNVSILISVVLFLSLMLLATPQIYIDAHFLKVLEAHMDELPDKYLVGKGYTYLKFSPVLIPDPDDPEDYFVNIRWSIIFMYMLVSGMVGLIVWLWQDRKKIASNSA